MNKKILLISLGIYMLSAVASYTVFSNLGSFNAEIIENDPLYSEEETALGALLQIDQSAPRDQECPLNGQLFTQVERDAWESRRPLAVMIENSPDARPQSGLARADVVFEAVAEGGVTRFMAMYYCGAQRYDTTIAPVRSARSYFVDWASGFNLPMYVHVGGANTPGPADALGQISDYGWSLENDINQFSVGYPTFVRNASRLGRSVATEHTMESSTEKLWDVAEERDWTNVTPARRENGRAVSSADWADGYEAWDFQDDDPQGTVTTISYEFWSGYSAYGVSWDYNTENNAYLRTMGGEPHIDLNNDKQVEVKNVVVILTEEKGPIDELKHMLYKTTGAGEALIFNNGDVIEGKWVKSSRTDELKFTDMKGDPIKFVRGQIWISVVDESTDVQY